MLAVAEAEAAAPEALADADEEPEEAEAEDEAEPHELEAELEALLVEELAEEELADEEEPIWYPNNKLLIFWTAGDGVTTTTGTDDVMVIGDEENVGVGAGTYVGVGGATGATGIIRGSTGAAGAAGAAGTTTGAAGAATGTVWVTTGVAVVVVTLVVVVLTVSWDLRAPTVLRAFAACTRLDVSKLATGFKGSIPLSTDSWLIWFLLD